MVVATKMLRAKWTPTQSAPFRKVGRFMMSWRLLAPGPRWRDYLTGIREAMRPIDGPFPGAIRIGRTVG
jgi:hypothetical protein